MPDPNDDHEARRLASEDPHPIASTSLYERMSAISRGERPSPIEAARAHLGGETDQFRQEIDEPRGSVEDAMIAGADPETGELPAREESVAAIPEQAAIAAEISARAPPPAAKTASVSSTVAAEAAPEPAAPSPPPPERQTFDSTPPPPARPAKQEVIEPERAADGGPAPYAASTLGELVNLLEGGQLSADAIGAVSALGQGMRELAERTGKRQKGRVAIVLNLATDDTGEAFFVEAEFKVTAPKEPRRKTMLWQDEKGRMTPSQPRQRVFFGVKDVGDAPRQIRQIP